MKRFVLLVIISLFFFIESKAIATTWIGASGGNWAIPGNWSNGVPTLSDDAIFNTGTAITVVFTTSPIDFNSLTITNTSSITFSTSATTVFRPHSTSSVLPGLLIDAGSSLIIDATNTGATVNNTAMNTTIAGGVTGSISGTLTFSSTGASTNTDIKLITSNTVSLYGIVTVNNGGSIIINPNAGNTVSSLTPVPTLVMKDGSVYEIAKNGGFFPAATWESNSTARASSPGATTPGFVDGMVYGNLEWNCPAQTDNDINANITFNNVHLINTHSFYFRVTGASTGSHTMTINGTLDIEPGSVIDIVGALAPSGSTGKVILKGHLNNQIGGLIITNGIAGTTSQFELQGSSNQNIFMNGTFSGVRMEFVMNGVSATLTRPLLLPGNTNATGANLQLVNGKIFTTATNFLRLNDNGTATGGSATSFVSGPMRKLGDDNFTFPLGLGSIYAPITITNVSGEAVGDQFIAEYKRANPQSIYGPNVASGMNHVSFVEYWTLTKSGTGASKLVSLDVHPTSFCKVLANTYVGHWSGVGMVWNNEGAVITAGPTPVGLYETGTIQSTAAISSFSSPNNNAFTLITDLPFISNPLPIDLISFDATKLTTTKASLNWELAAFCSAAARFELEKAGDNKSFSKIATVNGNETSRFYTHPDNDLKKGVNYYRLKMIDETGKITYSRTVAIMNGMDGLLLTSLIPTVVTSNATLTIASSGRQKLDLLIIDMQGRVLQKQNQTVVSGNTTIQLSTANLGAGIYQLTGVSAEGRTNTIRFVKQ